MVASDCVGVSGAGTPASPFEVALILSALDDNLVECTANGLYARAPVQTAADASMLVVDGGNLGDYDLSVQLSEVVGNGIILESDGLWAVRATRQLEGSAALFGGPVPADPHYIKEAGTVAASTNAGGHITIPISEPMDGILSIVYCLGDIPSVFAFHAIDNSTVSLTQFAVVFTDDALAPIVSGSFRINYEVTGWAV